MLRALLLCAYWLLPGSAHASPWVFSAPTDVSRVHGERVFHHLGSGGRHGIAVSGHRVAVAWEDNRDGVSHCYVAIKHANAGAFDEDRRVSGEAASYEPAVTGLGDGRFAIAWEEGGTVWTRLVDHAGAGPALALAKAPAAHVGLASHPSRGLIAAWSQKEDQHFQVWVGELTVPVNGTGAPIVAARAPVETGAIKADQLYPAIAVLPSGHLAVAWEDRRYGHTVIMAARSEGRHGFPSPVQMNESFWGGRDLGYGRGTGAMRVSLATVGSQEVIAAWADKRDYYSGYDVYAAFSEEQGSRFGANQKVQDGFADGVGQWHPSVSAGPDGAAAVVWDDDREQTPDVWLSWHTSAGWSDDLDVPGASGPGTQVEPAMTLDAGGNLHLAWVEKQDINAPSRIRYLFARRGGTEDRDQHTE